MFNVTDGNVVMSQGDTGSLTFKATREDGENFGEDDYAVFTIKSAAGEKVREQYFPLNGTENGKFVVNIYNNDTDFLSLGQYTYDVRIVIGAIWSGGRIVNGDNVITAPEVNQRTITLVATVGEV